RIQKLPYFSQRLRAMREQRLTGKIDEQLALFDLPFHIIFLVVVYTLSPIALVVFLVLADMGITIYYFKSGQALGDKKNLISSRFETDYFDLYLSKNFLTLKLYTNFGEFINKALTTEKKIQNLNVQNGLNALVGSWANQSLTHLLVVLVVFSSAIQIFDGNMQIGTMVALNLLVARSYSPIVNSVKLWRSRNEESLNAEIANLLSLKDNNVGRSEIKSFSGSLELRSLSHKYQSQKIQLYENFNFVFQPGSVTVITGGNGTGKTTLFRLLAGIIEPENGSILIDGVNLKQISKIWWRTQLTAVPQEPNFLDGTVLDNLLRARDGISDDEIARVIKDSGLSKFLDETELGLESPVDAFAPKHSLGFRKRFALARAMLINGPLVIMDEPTEGLDSDGAQLFYGFLNQCIRASRTVIVLSHDPAIIRGASTIINLDSRPHPKIIPVAKNQVTRDDAEGSKK
ncbi:MAG: ATP-binding cassette domain-containing protein, partial [Burkholderiaceae bacterium]